MLFHIPDNLPEEKKKQYSRMTLRILQTLVNAIRVIVFLVFVLLVFLVFESPIRDMLAGGPQPLTEEELAAREQARAAAESEDTERVENGIHVATGLKVAEGWEVVRSTCTACHSAALVTQNRATREGWKDMIRWMQETQGLWDLGDQESTILDYLAANYAPEEGGRRPNLDIAAIEWYVLELD